MAFVSTFVPALSRISNKNNWLCGRSTNTSSINHVGQRRTSNLITMSGESEYDQLSKITTIVEDTGDIEQISLHKPHSATTNPTLVAMAAKDERYSGLITDAVQYGKEKSLNRSEQLSITRDKLFTLFGAEIVKNLGSTDGDVSTEVDARLSFDIQAQIDVAHRIISMYENESKIPRERILIKLASTWEGIQACKQLESEGIKTNMTLLFSLPQAIAAAEANAFLISPFVGRILDWYKKEMNVDGFEPEKDPGVVSVTNIYNYYKCMNYNTIVMGASFRNKDEILQLAGCDRLTIAPKFISSLKETFGNQVDKKLYSPSINTCNAIEKLDVNEKSFRWLMNQDPMATEKLAHGIRGFASDLEKLDAQLQTLIDA